jgi:hypothetical protein
LEGNEGITFQSYGDIFNELCPYYMSIGMPYDEFWNGDVSAVKAYRKANELRDKRRNFELWLQGSYVYEALCDASPLFRFSMKKGVVKPEPYVKEPYPITEADVREREEREARKKEERLKAEFAAFAERIRSKMS